MPNDSSSSRNLIAAVAAASLLALSACTHASPSAYGPASAGTAATGADAAAAANGAGAAKAAEAMTPAAAWAKVADGDAAAQVNALAEAYFESYLELFPLLATEIGDHRYDDRLADDLSPKGRAKVRALADRTREALSRIPRGSLAGQALLTHEVLEERTQAVLDGLQFSDHLMPLEQLDALPVYLPVLGSGVGSQRFETVKDYENFLGRIAAFDGWVTQAIENMREGLRTGFTRPRPVMERTVLQLAEVAGHKPEETAFWGPMKRFPAGFSTTDRERLTNAYRAALSQTLIPAYDRLHAFAKNEYLPKIRSTTAIEALPDGPARYAFLVRDNTTSPLDPHAIHLLGHSEVKRILGEVDALRREVGFEGTTAEFTARMRQDPSHRATTGEELLAGYNALKATVTPHLPELFGKLPKADFEVRLVEPFREASAPSQYTAATPDGSRPGIFYANAAGLKSRPSRPSESLFLHEALPGHHLQVALASENTALPRLRRFAPYNAYIEGWALYAERLGAQLGLYKDTPARLGQLGSELFRAMRLVVDTGMHHEGWSRQKAIDYIAETSGIPGSFVVAEIDRYLAIPGQALGYKIGELSIRGLRTKAEQRLGPKFDLRAFHDAVLENGALPLSILERTMNDWIEARAR